MTQIEQWALGEGARTAQPIAGATSQMAPSLLGTPEGSPQNSPRMQPTADPIWGRQDPWRASSFGPAPRNTRGAAFETYQGPGAAAATAAGSAPTPPAAPQPVHTGGPPFREFRIDSRGWSSHQKALDAGVSPEAFQVWRERALVHLSQGRQDVRRLLSWAEGEDAAEVQARAADRAQMPDFVQVNFALHGAIMQIIGDSLLGRARCSDEHGLLLWRNLCAEWAGSAPQYRHAKAKQFQDPLRAKDMAALWSALPAWERLGEEVRTAGFDVPEGVKSAALEKLLACSYEAADLSKFEDYDDQYRKLLAKLDSNSSTEKVFLDFLHANGIRLPDDAQKTVDGIYVQPDFYYKPGTWVFVDGSVHDRTEVEADDLVKREAMRNAGLEYVVWRYDQDLSEWLQKRSDIFRKVRE